MKFKLKVSYTKIGAYSSLLVLPTVLIKYFPFGVIIKQLNSSFESDKITSLLSFSKNSIIILLLTVYAYHLSFLLKTILFIVFTDNPKQYFKFNIFEFASGSTKLGNFSGVYLTLNKSFLFISWFFGSSGAMFEVSNLFKASWSILKSVFV